MIATADFDETGGALRGADAGDEDDFETLRLRAAAAEEEVTLLRRRLQESPRRVQTLEEKLLETKGQLAQAVSQNEKLTFTLQTAKEHVANLREEVEKLTQPPAAYGTYPRGQRRRNRRRVLGWAKDAGLAPPRHRVRRAASGATRSSSTSRST